MVTIKPLKLVRIEKTTGQMGEIMIYDTNMDVID